MMLGIITIEQGQLVHTRQHNFCKGKPSGNHPDPNRCDGYIACNGRTPYKMNCPASLHYNVKTDQCDWPYNINPRCHKGIRPRHCPKENGYCVRPNGWDQNSGVIKLDSVDGNTEKQQASCLARCHTYAQATGCEEIWHRGNRGCYVHTREVARGNGVRNHACWVFSKCKAEQHWSEWSNWSSCSTTCDDGMKRRKRKCNGGNECKGKREEVIACHPCQGQWSEWSKWSVCTKTCGGGEKERRQDCKIRNNNNNCIRARKEMTVCNTRSCKDRNPCKVNNGGCSDDCSYKASKVKCTCRIDSILDEDKKTCIPIFPLYNRPTCGKDTVRRNRWIWQAAIYSDKRYVCGGALISPKVLVTTANCVSKRNKKYFVKLGQHETYRRGKSFEQQRSVHKVILHNKWKKASLGNDIAILTFKVPFTLTENVGPICLPGGNTALPGNKRCYVTGWGSIKDKLSNRRLQRSSEMSIIPNNRCNCPVVGGKRRKPMVTTNIVCGEFKRGESTFSGYRGGLLICRTNNGDGWVLEGLLSWGSQQCKDQRRKFNVFTRISKYATWLNERNLT